MTRPWTVAIALASIDLNAQIWPKTGKSRLQSDRMIVWTLMGPALAKSNLLRKKVEPHAKQNN